MQQLLTTTEPRTAAEAFIARSCDDKACDEPAVFAYTWDWGGGGVCCAKHQFTNQQTAESLQRKVNFAPLLAPGPVPITRDERVKLKAEVYALEAEAEDLKSRGAELYRENTALTRQVQASTTRLRETELLLSESKAKLDELQWKLEKRDAEQGAMVDELTRLRTLSKFTEGQADLAAKLKKTEQQLADSEARERALVAGAPRGAVTRAITTLDTVTGAAEETTVIDGPSGTHGTHGKGNKPKT